MWGKRKKREAAVEEEEIEEEEDEVTRQICLYYYYYYYPKMCWMTNFRRSAPISTWCFVDATLTSTTPATTVRDTLVL